jgi:hypothetical protein
MFNVSVEGDHQNVGNHKNYYHFLKRHVRFASRGFGVIQLTTIHFNRFFFASFKIHCVVSKRKKFPVECRFTNQIK